MISFRSSRSWFWIIAVLGVILDIGSKYTVFTWLEDERPVIRGLFSLVPQRPFNQGALFGLGHQHGELANLVFALFSGLAVLVIVTWAMRPSTTPDWILRIALGLILAGALGNLYDRLVFGGVRDFLWVYYPRADGSRLSWPVFNLADSCLVCGAGLLLLQAFFFSPPVENQESEVSGQRSEVNFGS